MKITRNDLNEIKEKVKEEGNYKIWQYKCFIYIIERSRHLGYLKGYVLLPRNHKYYWKYYENIPVKSYDGLRYSKEEYWFWKIGFDCANDLVPSTVEELMEDKQQIEYRDCEYKDMQFVEKEIKKLIDQL